MATLFNSTSVQIVMGGKVLGTARRYESTETREVEDIHVLGSANAFATVASNKMYSGTLTILAEEADSFTRSLPEGTSPTDVEVDIIALFTAPGQASYKEVLEGVRFTEWKRTVEQGAKFIEVPIPFKCRNITRA